MMKKLLLFFVGLVCSLHIFAEDVTFGITRTITNNTLSDDINVGTNVEGVTFSRIYGTQSAMTDKARKIYHGSTTELSVPAGIKNYRNKIGSTDVLAYNTSCYYSFKLSVAKGKELTIKSINGDMFTDGDGFVYRMVVVNNDETVYTCGDKTISKYTDSSVKSVDCTTGEDKFAKLIGMSGTVQVYMYWWNGASKTGKYFDIKDFNVVAEVKDAATQTKYTKPSISQGAYNKNEGTYAVTLSTQNDEEGVINYIVGSADKVSGVLSGTIINVAPNTAIKATVSGSAYTESDEATLTTAAAPKLAQPTYSIGAFNFETQKYTVTLAAAEGTIKYAIGSDAYAEYTEALVVDAGTVIKAKAEKANMTASDEITITAPAAPVDGESATPTTATYTDGMTYNAGAFTIPSTNSYIGGKVGSGNSSINGCIKMRMSRECDPASPKGYGFHILVNSGYVLKNVKLQILNNYTGDKANANLVAVFVDGVNKLDASVLLPKATANTVEPAVVELNDIYATSKVVFQFAKVAEGDDNPNQAQVLISADAIVPVYNDKVTPDGFGTVYYDKELVCPEGTTAFTGSLNGDYLTLTELADGIIPANTPAIIEGNGGLFTLGTSKADAVESSLKGTATAIAASSVEGGTVCVLGYEDGEAGFFKFTGATLAANKAYLVIPTTDAKANIRIVKGDEDATGISVVKSQSKSGVIYNLAGQRVSANAKGLVIINGKVVKK